VYLERLPTCPSRLAAHQGDRPGARDPRRREAAVSPSSPGDGSAATGNLGSFASTVAEDRRSQAPRHALSRYSRVDAVVSSRRRDDCGVPRSTSASTPSPTSAFSSGRAKPSTQPSRSICARQPLLNGRRATWPSATSVISNRSSRALRPAANQRPATDLARSHPTCERDQRVRLPAARITLRLRREFCCMPPTCRGEHWTHGMRRRSV